MPRPRRTQARSRVVELEALDSSDYNRIRVSELLLDRVPCHKYICLDEICRNTSDDSHQKEESVVQEAKLLTNTRVLNGDCENED